MLPDQPFQRARTEDDLKAELEREVQLALRYGPVQPLESTEPERRTITEFGIRQPEAAPIDSELSKFPLPTHCRPPHLGWISARRQWIQLVASQTESNGDSVIADSLLIRHVRRIIQSSSPSATTNGGLCMSRNDVLHVNWIRARGPREESKPKVSAVEKCIRFLQSTNI